MTTTMAASTPRWAHQSGGGVPPGCTGDDRRHPAEVGVAAPDGHGPGGHDHAHHGQGRPPTPVQRRAGHGEHQQDGDRDVADGADDQRVAGPVGHEHRPQEDRGRQDGVRGPEPAGEGPRNRRGWSAGIDSP